MSMSEPGNRYTYDGESVFLCKGCETQLYIKQPQRIPVDFITGFAHTCTNPTAFSKARKGPGQGRGLVMKKDKKS